MRRFYSAPSWRVARRDSAGNVFYYFADHLGTTRTITDANGNICYDAEFTPYGQEMTKTNTCPQNYKFTGYERDTETGNDDFGARYYSNRFGRWLSADWSAVPVPVPYANLTNPQTLNLYAMVADDPESFADLDGHLWHGSNLIEDLEIQCSELCVFGVHATIDNLSTQQAVQRALALVQSALNNPNFINMLPVRIANEAQNQNQDQNQQNQQTQNNQPSTTEQPATPAQSGINPNYTFDHILGKVSDFSAGAADCLTGRCLFLDTSLSEKIRQLNGADNFVDKKSRPYFGGKITGGAVGAGIAGLAAANAAVGLESKVAIHGAHHAFQYLGGARLAHVQIIMWIAGQKGSTLVNWHIPLPWK